MPLFEIRGSDELVPFRRLGGPELYEQEIEELLWESLEDFTGESLFRVRRQPSISGGGRPDLVALDRQGSVVVIEVKRDVDRSQLAQCLEYAGWARATSLDEIASLYHAGSETFWSDWQEFTGSSSPVGVRRSPRLILVARDFHGRTASAFEFLVENRLPVQLVRVSLYEDEEGRKFVDVEGEHEPDFTTGDALEVADSEQSADVRRRIRLVDLIEAGVLTTGQELVWDRPRSGQNHRATVMANGSIRLADGRAFSSPSLAAVKAVGGGSFDGWLAWRLGTPSGPLLDDVRQSLLKGPKAGDSGPSPGV